MTMKFKIGFTIDSQTMFGMLAKFLPVENLHVEEIIEHASPVSFSPRIQHAKLAKPTKRARPNKDRINLREGANGCVFRHLSDGQPHSAIELKPVFKTAGYAESGVGARLQKLKEAGVLFQPEFGLWQLTPAYLATDTQSETAA